MVNDEAYVDIAFFTKNDSCNNILKVWHILGSNLHSIISWQTGTFYAWQLSIGS
jgi:hypothetical protein